MKLVRCIKQTPGPNPVFYGILNGDIKKVESLLDDRSGYVIKYTGIPFVYDINDFEDYNKLKI